jgi:hypothetical protein
MLGTLSTHTGRTLYSGWAIAWGSQVAQSALFENNTMRAQLCIIQEDLPAFAFLFPLSPSFLFLHFKPNYLK